MAKNSVIAVPAASSQAALEHFNSEFVFETDPADVYDALNSGEPGFVLLDVRAPDRYQAGHVPGAINIPHRKIIESKMAAFPADTLFVVYCDGTHCNGATRGAIRLAELGRPVKKMVGGLHGWELDGFSLERSQ